ncbi:MAG: T9SS type A sorting domain-containing protein, partial [Bacteroidia bacterium]|nr:T9SS type A sorting domain-containing protein [Bacteroidia bacterium]
VSYLLSSSGIGPPVYSPTGATFIAYGPSADEGSLGQMKISPSGTKLGLTYPGFNSSGSFFAVADFNRSTGVVANYLQLAVLPTNGRPAYGCEFSPDGSKFYGSVLGASVSSSNIDARIYQWNLSAGSSAAIISSLYTLNTPTVGFYSGGMQLAPDGKIYTGAGWNTSFLSAITNPNQAGSACNFVLNALSIGTGSNSIGMVNFVSSLVKAPFSYLQGQNCNSSVSFTPASAFNTTVTGLSWSFGDSGSGPANVSTLSNPVHTYPSQGNYSVVLVISYANCAADTIKQVISIQNLSLSVTQASTTCNGLGTGTLNVIPSGGQLTFTWMPSMQTLSVAQNLSPGIYTVSVKNTSVNCTPSFTTLITQAASIDYSLTVIQASATCSGLGTATVSAVSPGAYTFSWTPVSQSGSVVSNLSPGTYTVYANNSASQCTQTFTTVIITPAQISGIVTTTATCTDGDAKINMANGSGNYTYLWTPGSQNTQTANNLSPGLYTVTVNDINNQCSITETLQITALSSPTLSASPGLIICKGESATFTVTGADTYSWSQGSTNTLVITTPTVTTIYSVTGTYSQTGCSSFTTIVLTVAKCQGVGELTTTSPVKSYPNPCADVIALECYGKMEFLLCNNLGQVVSSGELTKGKNSIKLGDLPAGIYFIKVFTEEDFQILRFVKQD